MEKLDLSRFDPGDSGAFLDDQPAPRPIGDGMVSARVKPESTPESAPSPSPAESQDDDALARLAALPPMEYDRVRKEEAGKMGVRPATLDKEVAAARRGDDGGMGIEEVEPWPDPIHPAQLLSDIAGTVRRFIVCLEETAHAASLWIAMTWFIDVIQVAPLAVITAPEKRCGKSQLLFVLGRLVRRPLPTSNISSAALFRTIDVLRPTLLVDEADAFMKGNEELRGLLDCGHTRDSAFTIRLVGESHTPARFNVWGAKALAGIGHLADTLMDRAITLELRRKLPQEQVERLRHAEPDLFERLAAKLARFAEDYREAVRRSQPDLPISLNDRAQDNWEPLLAIAEAAGGPWPELARKAALKLSGADGPTLTVGTELLSDIQEIFEIRSVDRISTATLITALCDDDEKPWATYNRGKPISPRQVSKRLGEYGIRSKNVRFGGSTPKGFTLDQFEEVFSRYLTPPENAATPPQIASSRAEQGFQRGVVSATATLNSKSSVAEYPPCGGNTNASATPEALPLLGCGAVADKRRESGNIIEVEF